MIVKNKTLLFFLILTVYGSGLFFFYWKYVPLVKPFQLIFAPILFLASFLTLLNPRRGTLFFIFLFPLINNLPYFFKLYEPLPFAPSSLVLFLFFFWGWLGSRLRDEKKLQINAPLFKPIICFSFLVIISALITFWRYTNFVPLRSDRIYELITNTHGVSAGGAIMSVIFFSLNYLSGMAFFTILIQTFNGKKDFKKILTTVCVSASISLAFGMLQHFMNLNLGNNPTSIALNAINSSFKDALSFGAYLSILIPLILGLFFAFQGMMRLISFFILAISIFLLFFTGSKSGMLSLSFSLCVFLLLNAKALLNSLKPRNFSLRKAHWSTIVVVFFMIILTINVLFIRKGISEKISQSKTIERIKTMLAQKTLGDVFYGRANSLWKSAIPMIKDYPITGLGMGSYIIEVSNYAKSHDIFIDVPESAENYFLQVGSELGWVGIILVIWIFWELARQMKRALNTSPGNRTNRVISTGICAAIVSFLISIQVHTFIGSYEIKYFFWLLVGLLFFLERTNPDLVEDKVKMPSLGKKQKYVLAVFLGIYGVIHLWNSTHSLSLPSQTERLGLKQDFGFYMLEKNPDGREFRWTRSYGGQTIRVEKAIMRIPLSVSHPDIQKKPVNVKFFIVKDLFKSKRLLGEVRLTSSIWKNYEFPVPDELNREIILLVEVDRTWNPHRALKIPDPRNLGVAVGKIEFADFSPNR